LNHENYLDKKQYDFGTIFYYSRYVVSKINLEYLVDTPTAARILSDIDRFYQNQKFVYISNREIDHNVDLSVYKLVNPKKLIGIAIVCKERSKIKQVAAEQKLYDGSFGFFKNMSSAIAWAQLLVEEHN
jgi:hypothetical protein